MSVLLSKAKTDPEQKITEGLNLKNILQIIDHMAYISAWKDDSTMANYPHNEPELRQVLDFSIRSTQVQENGLLSSEILEEKKDLESSVIPLEEMFKKPSIINPNNLSKITEAFKDSSGLDLAKGKLLDIYSVPVDPGKPQWLSSTYIRTYTDKEEDTQEECQSVNTNNSFYRIAYMEPLLSDTRRANSIRSGQKSKAVSGQDLSAVNNYTSTVVNENIADAQKALSDLFNPNIHSEKNASIAEACKNFETQYPSIAKNPMILINDDTYCNYGVLHILCEQGKYEKIIEAFESAMPKLKNEEDKDPLRRILIGVAGRDNIDIEIKLRALLEVLPLLKNSSENNKESKKIEIPQYSNLGVYATSLNKLIKEKPELNKVVLDYIDNKIPRKSVEDIWDTVRLLEIISPKPADTPPNNDLVELIQKLQGEFICKRFDHHFAENKGKLASGESTITTDRTNILPKNGNLERLVPSSLKKISITDLYSLNTMVMRIEEDRPFTQKEIQQAIEDYYNQGANYQLQ
jgi:tetratricopeptide (TPR) repeat protein